MPSDAKLLKLAGQGDQAAFGEIVTVRYQALITGQCMNWRRQGIEFEDLRQEALSELWTALRRRQGAAKIDEPAKWIATIVHHACSHYHQWSRAQKRWPSEPGVPIDSFEHPDTLHWPAWYFTEDPLYVVIARDSLKRSWRSLTDHRREVINAWLTGERLDHAAKQTFSHARRQASAILDSPDGMAPGCSSRRRCAGCGEHLPAGRPATAKWCSETCRAAVRRQDPEHRAYHLEYSRLWKAEQRRQLKQTA